ncbi:MAG: folylpolyglutamate synthase/dihydrofolate synthase family protein [Synergistaceae bacterium]
MENFYEIETKLNNLASPGIRPGLARMSRLMMLLGHPERGFHVVHVAGSNGKGSVASTISSILVASGYKTALYTSPHLVTLAERLKINNKEVEISLWERNIEIITDVINKDPILKKDCPTFFELVTAIAFMVIKDQHVDVAVLETGLGGRLDATNIVKHVDISIITSICMDHCEYLGNTELEISREKFSIMRKDKPVVYLADSPDLSSEFSKFVIKRNSVGILLEKNKQLLEKLDFNGTDVEVFFDNKSVSLHTPLIGIHQADNLRLAVEAIKLLAKSYTNINLESIKLGLNNLRWSGRFEIISTSPLLILDGAHNPKAMRALVDTIKLINTSKKINIILAMMSDKDILSSIEILGELNSNVYCTLVPNLLRSASAKQLAQYCSELKINVIDTFEEPLDALKNVLSDDAVTIVCGSLYLIGYIKTKLLTEDFICHDR